MEFIDIMRLVNTLFSFLALVFLIMVARFRWHQMSDRMATMWHALLGWTVLGFISSLENYIQHNPPGSRTYVTTIVIVLTVRGAYSYIKIGDRDDA